MSNITIYKVDHQTGRSVVLVRDNTDNKFYPINAEIVQPIQIISGTGILNIPNMTGIIKSTGQGSVLPAVLEQDYYGPGSIVPISAGGTAANNAIDARANLGLIIGTNIQAYNSNLANLANITGTGLIYRSGNGLFNNILMGQNMSFVTTGGRGVLDCSVPLVSIETLRVPTDDPDESDRGKPVRGNIFTAEQARINSKAIQAYINMIGRANGPFIGLYVPGKSFVIDRTIYIWSHLDGAGTILQGNGGNSTYNIRHTTGNFSWGRERPNENGQRQGGLSELVWMGPVTGTDPMLYIPGMGGVVRGIQFHGYFNPTGTPFLSIPETGKVYAAIEMSRPVGGGIPTGKMFFDDLSFIHCRRAYLIGGTTNADSTAFGAQRITACHCGWEVTQEQSVGFYCSVAYIESIIPITVVRAIAGGRITFGLLDVVSPGTLFETYNAQTTFIANVCLDANFVRSGSMLVNQIGTGYCTFILQGHWGNPVGGNNYNIPINSIRLTNRYSQAFATFHNWKNPIDIYTYGPPEQRKRFRFQIDSGVRHFFDINDSFQKDHVDLDYSPSYTLDFNYPNIYKVPDYSMYNRPLFTSGTSTPLLELRGCRGDRCAMVFRIVGNEVNRGLLATGSSYISEIDGAANLEGIYVIAPEFGGGVSRHSIAGVTRHSNTGWQLYIDPTEKLNFVANNNSTQVIVTHPSGMKKNTIHVVAFQYRGNDGQISLWIDDVQHSVNTVLTGTLKNVSGIYEVGLHHRASSIDPFRGVITAGLVATDLSDNSRLSYRMTELAVRYGGYLPKINITGALG